MMLTPKFQRRLAILGAAVALFAIFGFVVLPPIVKSQMEKRLSSALGRDVTVEKVRINPFALSLSVENFAIREKDGTRVFLGWRRLYVRADALSSIWGAWTVGAIDLDGFNVRVVLNADQSMNFSDLLAKFAAPGSPAAAAPAQPSKPGRPIRVRRLEVSGARLEFSDLSRKRPFATTVGPLTFGVTEFRTAGQVGAPYRFEAVTEANERFTWSGTVQADPVGSSGDFSVENVVLAKYAPYYADRLRAELAGGLLSVSGHYDLSLADGRRVAKLANGTVKLRDFKLLEGPGGPAAVELPRLDVTGIAADALSRKAAIGSVVLAGGRIRARREKDGTINLLAMLAPPGPAAAPLAAAPAAPASASAAAPPPDVTVGEFAIKGFQVDVADLAGPRPAELALGAVRFSLRDISLAPGARMPLQLAFDWAPHGSVRVDGEVGMSPLEADLKTSVTGFDLLPLSPYLEQFVNARITQGSVTATLAVTARISGGKPPAATVAGDVAIDRFGLVDGARNKELAGFASLSLRGLRATTTPGLSVSLAEIALAGSYARIVVNGDKTVNLSAVMRPGTRSAAASPGPAPLPAASPGPAPRIEIGKVTISGGNYRFTDRSLEPNVTMAITGFGGTITGLSSDNVAKADLDINAMVDDSGPISIVGKLDPLGARKTVDLKVKFRSVDLVPLGPYTGKFAGYDLARGQLFVDVNFLLDGKKIDATNVVTLNQFTFGDPVKSPDATHLPVRLGVALLKDVDGKIVIDVPIQGSTDDPNFKIGKMVLRVVVNLLTKAAVSPFSLVGSMFGGGGEELAYQEFDPGASDLQPAGIRKLQTMTAALTNRPGLSLDLEGSCDTAADAYALRRLKLADQVRRAVWELKRQSNPDIAPPDRLVVAPGETAAMIKRLFDAKFPPGTKFGTPLPQPPPIVAPPPPPAGFLKRLLATLTFRPLRERRAARKENLRQAAAYSGQVAAAKAAGLPVAEMAGRLAETIAVTDDDLRGLAAARAQRVRDYLVTTGHIGADRIFLSQGRGTAMPDKGPRVFLSFQ